MLKFENVTVIKKVKDKSDDSGYKELTILDNVGFYMEEELVYAVLGPSGSGKSTLLRMINRLDDPSSGKVTLDGKDVREIPVLELRRKVGYVFQLPFMFEGTILDNILYGPDLAGKDRDEEQEKVEKYLPWFGFDKSILERDPSRLSVGEKQRICILRAIMNEPEILLLDEPTASLDPTSAVRILDLVKEINKKSGTQILMVTHIPEHARKIADRVIVLMNGKIATVGKTGDVFENPDHPVVKDFLNGNLENGGNESNDDIDRLELYDDTTREV